MISYRSSRKISSHLVRNKYNLLTEQLVVTNAVVNVAKCVNVLQKLMLLLELLQGKPLR